MPALTTTKAQEAWFSKLQKHFEKMPDGIEVIVTAQSIEVSRIVLLPKGTVESFHNKMRDDVAVLDANLDAESFYADNVIADSESF